MAPENDSAPKAPDKGGNKASRAPGCATAEDKVESLDDGQLKALLDEAIAYKTPKDREGKSELFRTLLTDAEDEIRKDLAKTASGSELARYYNTTANRRRSKRQPSSISENLTHGGSLNDLAKEDLYESATNLQRPKKTVSARQREGGSLPCNVNVDLSYDRQFFEHEHARRKRRPEHAESERLLKCGEQLQQSVAEPQVELEVKQTTGNVYMSKLNVQIDDCFGGPERGQEKAGGSGGGAATTTTAGATVAIIDDSLKHMHYGLGKNAVGATRGVALEERKVDENGNAVSHGAGTLDGKKRKKSGKKSEDVIKAEDVKGHRADIINDIDELVRFISGPPPASSSSSSSGRSVAKIGGKLPKQQHVVDGKAHKQRTRPPKVTAAAVKAAANHHHHRHHHHGHLQKSTSMEEISMTKLEDFHFAAADVGAVKQDKPPLRSTKSNAERPRDRKSWVLSSEQLQMYQVSGSMENLETADFTYPKKKKSKKRRNSLGSRKQPRSTDACAAEFHRVPSPRRRRKSVCSAPHSEKSADSSDAESLADDSEPSSLAAAAVQPISYADIARSVDRPKTVVEKKKSCAPSSSSSGAVVKSEVIASNSVEPLTATTTEVADPPADLSSLNWPEIRNNKVNAVAAKNFENAQHDWPTIHGNNVGSYVRSNPDNKPNKVGVTVLQPQQQQRPPNRQINNIKSVGRTAPKFDEHGSLSPVAIIKDNIFCNSQQIIQKVSEQQPLLYAAYQMPPNIRDVQSIEKMQLKNLRSPPQANYLNNGSGDVDVGPSSQQQLPPEAADKRPAVVILSGGDRHVSSDITFGFPVNEQLLCDPDDRCGQADVEEDEGVGDEDVTAEFISRFFLPETPQAVHIEKLVDYIGGEWENVLVQTSSGKVKYYTSDL